MVFPMPSFPLFSVHVPVISLYFPNRKFPCRSFDPWAHTSKSVHVRPVLSQVHIVLSCSRPPDAQHERNAKVSDDGGGEWSAGLQIHVSHDSVAQRCNEPMYAAHDSGT